MRDRARPEGDVDERVEVEEPVALRLRVAAADGDHLLGIGELQHLRVPEVRREPLVRLLADRARVEDEDVGLLLRDGLPQSELLEHALDPLRVVSVHLAPERRDVVALHGPEILAGPRRTSRTLGTISTIAVETTAKTAAPTSVGPVPIQSPTRPAVARPSG